MTKEQKQVVDFIRQTREGMEMTQYAFAKLLSVAQSQVGRWESGSSEPRASVFMQIINLSGKKLS